MQTKKRQPATGLIDHLFDEPARYQFKQALRMLLIWLRTQGVNYEDAFRHVLRFQNSVSLGFPASEIEALKAEVVSQQAPPDGHRENMLTAPERIAITPAFIGLLGASGTLPYHYSERIGMRQLHEKDESARAFLDILSNRLVGLFFEAWGKYRLEIKVDTHGIDPLRPLLLQLGGCKGGESVEHGKGAKDVLAYFAATFRARPMSAHAITSVLTDHFGVPINIEQFVGCWDYLGANQRTILGKATPTLGFGATLGSRIWRHDLRVRLHIGPLAQAELDPFLPTGDASAAMAQLLRQFGVSHLEFEVRLILKPECIKQVVLTANRPAAMRLGWESFLTTQNGKATRGDIGYLLTMRGARPPPGKPLRRVI